MEGTKTPMGNAGNFRPRREAKGSEVPGMENQHSFFAKPF